MVSKVHFGSFYGTATANVNMLSLLISKKSMAVLQLINYREE